MLLYVYYLHLSMSTALNSISDSLHNLCHPVVSLEFTGSGIFPRVLGTVLRLKSSERSDRKVHQFNGLVDVALVNLISETQSCQCLGETDYGKECTGCDVHVRLLIKTFSLKFSLFNIFGNYVVVQVVGNDRLKFLRFDDKGTHDVSFNNHEVISGGGSEGFVDCSYVTGKGHIVVFLNLIKEKEEKVETR